MGKPGKTIWYFDHINTTLQCFEHTVRRYFPVANLTRTRQAVIVEPLRPERFFVRTFNATSLYILSICEVCGSYQCPYCPFYSVHCNQLLMDLISNKFFYYSGQNEKTTSSTSKFITIMCVYKRQNLVKISKYIRRMLPFDNFFNDITVIIYCNSITISANCNVVFHQVMIDIVHQYVLLLLARESC